MSHDPNSLRLYPIDYNELVRTQSVNELDLLLDPFIPNGWQPNPDSTILGGDDSAKGIERSSDGFGNPDEGSGNA